MNSNIDEEIVSGWLAPVELDEMLAALRHAGFSGDVYRGGYADLNATLEGDRAGALHFLRHGYAESRVFGIALDPGGLERLRQLPVRNRVYLMNVVIALATAWTGSNIRSSNDVARHRSVIDQFRSMGGVPLFILGDASASLYRRGVLRDERWICPLAMTPLQGGIEELLRTPTKTPRQDTGREAIPTIWKFGQHDMQAGYPVHRQRHGIGPGDMDASAAFATPVIKAYAAYLARNIPVQERPQHWIASLLPPAWQAGSTLQDQDPVVDPDSLLDQTAMYRRFNILLEKAVVELGFDMVRNFDSFLSRSGVIDEHYLVEKKNSDLPSYSATEGILSTSLWAIVDSRPAAVPSATMQEQFRQLLDEIRTVQMGEPA